MGIREELDAQERFGQRYGREVLPAAVAAERVALGSDYGANGYTSRAQADDLATALSLTPADRLLDIGAGCSWPGLYLAHRSGCQVVVTDLTAAAMRRAVRRAADDGMSSVSAAMVASARHLLFRPESFDAIVHTDVLC